MRRGIFVIEMMPLNHLLGNVRADIKLQKRINHLMYIGYTKLFTKNEKESDPPPKKNKKR